MSESRFLQEVRSVAHTLAALTSNCAEFSRLWRDAERQTRASGLSGGWVGEWISEANGHRGQLQCVLSETGSKKYRASFHATYSKVLRVCYTVELRGSTIGSQTQLEGETDLGRLAGGIYHYSGTAGEGQFQCQYRCSYDHGTFRLRKLNSHP